MALAWVSSNAAPLQNCFRALAWVSSNAASLQNLKGLCLKSLHWIWYALKCLILNYSAFKSISIFENCMFISISIILLQIYFLQLLFRFSPMNWFAFSQIPFLFLSLSNCSYVMPFSLSSKVQSLLVQDY